jgi:hypothetical protein
MLVTTSRKSSSFGCMTFLRLNIKSCRVNPAARSAAK